jgi:hypothetical protein
MCSEVGKEAERKYQCCQLAKISAAKYKVPAKKTEWQEDLAADSAPKIGDKRPIKSIERDSATLIFFLYSPSIPNKYNRCKKYLFLG